MEIFAWLILILCLMVGLLGTFLPILPGTVLVLIGALIHKWVFPNILNRWVIFAVAGIVFLTWLIDFIAIYIGTRWGRASKFGFTGAMTGAFVGLLFPPLGFLAGPAVGTVVAELMARRNLHDCLWSGGGSGF